MGHRDICREYFEIVSDQAAVVPDQVRQPTWIFLKPKITDKKLVCLDALIGSNEDRAGGSLLEQGRIRSRRIDHALGQL